MGGEKIVGHTIINKRVKCPTCGHEHILRRTGAYRDKPQKFIRCSQCKTVWKENEQTEQNKEPQSHNVKITTTKEKQKTVETTNTKQKAVATKRSLWDKIF